MTEPTFVESINKHVGTCEVCDAEGVVVTRHYNDMWFCYGCWGKEELSQQDNKIPVEIKQEETIDPLNNAIQQSRQIDGNITVRTDLFNAATTSILELKATIDDDASITNKPFALAEELMRRFTHHREVIFELNQKVVEAGNAQKAIQVYLNQLANSLRSEEREKLRLADITYKPASPKVDKVKPIKTRAAKLDKVELRKYAAELGVSEFTLQMVVVQKGITVEAAANMLRRSIKESQSEVRPAETN
jgi:uncharacterized coiled-coil protein SlyX